MTNVQPLRDAGDLVALIEVSGDEIYRAFAEVFEHPKGIAFADLGWPSGDHHPFHVLEGELRPAVGGKGWVIGPAWIHPVSEAVQDMRPQFADWHAWRKTGEGKPFDRARCGVAMEEAGIFGQ